jgi:hypothetical protein
MGKITSLEDSLFPRWLKIIEETNNSSGIKRAYYKPGTVNTSPLTTDFS